MQFFQTFNTVIAKFIATKNEIKILFITVLDHLHHTILLFFFFYQYAIIYLKIQIIGVKSY